MTLAISTNLVVNITLLRAAPNAVIFKFLYLKTTWRNRGRVRSEKDTRAALVEDPDMKFEIGVRELRNLLLIQFLLGI
jgi:hypothetical protein